MTFGAVILAGGSSSRMGRCKAEIVIGGETLLAHTVRQLADFPELWLSANDPGLAEGLPVLLAADRYPDAGPLAGIEAALSATDTDALVCFPCDLPNLTAELPRLLAERFSPELNKLAGAYMARLTGDRYAAVTLTRELEGAAARPGDVLPRSVLYLSRGTADQLYLAVRLAVCRLCLPDKPPILLDDALAAFDDQRLTLALELLAELAREQQILLFTCQRREGQALEQAQNVTRLTL